MREFTDEDDQMMSQNDGESPGEELVHEYIQCECGRTKKNEEKLVHSNKKKK